MDCFICRHKTIAPPNMVGFNYFSLLHNEVTKSLVVIFTHSCLFQKLPVVLKSSDILISSCDHCIEIDIYNVHVQGSFFLGLSILRLLQMW